MDTLPKYSIDALHTDPPMNLAYDRQFTRDGIKPVDLDFGDWDYFGSAGRNSTSKLDKESNIAFIDFTKSWLKKADRLLKATATIVIWMPDRYLSHIRDYLLWDLGYTPPSTFYWHATNPAPRFIKTTLVSSVIPCLVTVKRKQLGKINWLSEFSHMHNFMEHPIVGGNERVHPCQKPMAVTKRLLKIFTNEGDIVLDPFSGGGTTAMCCEEMNRKWVAIERDPEHFKNSTKRLEKYTTSEKLF